MGFEGHALAALPHKGAETCDVVIAASSLDRSDRSVFTEADCATLLRLQRGSSSRLPGERVLRPSLDGLGANRGRSGTAALYEPRRRRHQVPPVTLASRAALLLLLAPAICSTLAAQVCDDGIACTVDVEPECTLDRLVYFGLDEFDAEELAKCVVEGSGSQTVRGCSHVDAQFTLQMADPPEPYLFEGLSDPYGPFPGWLTFRWHSCDCDQVVLRFTGVLGFDTHWMFEPCVPVDPACDHPDYISWDHGDGWNDGSAVVSHSGYCTYQGVPIGTYTQTSTLNIATWASPEACTHTPDDSLCSDGFSCTQDSCDASAGCARVPDHSQCDDGKICTVDSCNPQGGTPDAAGCVFRNDDTITPPQTDPNDCLMCRDGEVTSFRDSAVQSCDASLSMALDYCRLMDKWLLTTSVIQTGPNGSDEAEEFFCEANPTGCLGDIDPTCCHEVAVAHQNLGTQPIKVIDSSEDHQCAASAGGGTAEVEVICAANCVALAPFADAFESGDTSKWSKTVP